MLPEIDRARQRGGPPRCADAEPDEDWPGQPDEDDDVDERGVARRHADTKLQTRLIDKKLQRKL
ncbi:MAG: hypothetical protein ACC662_01230, partial [Planctomycetota bacterium]